MSDYPEHEKLSKVQDASQAIGEFLDWLTGEQGVQLCRWQSHANNGQPRYVGPNHPRSQELNPHGIKYVDNPDFEERLEGLYPDGRPIQELLAEYFGVDLQRLDSEKRVILDRLRTASWHPDEGKRGTPTFETEAATVGS